MDHGYNGFRVSKDSIEMLTQISILRFGYKLRCHILACHEKMRLSDPERETIWYSSHDQKTDASSPIFTKSCGQ